MNTDNPTGGAILTLATAQSEAETISDWIADNLNKTVVELKKPGGREVLLEVYFDSPLEAEIASRVLADFPVFGQSVREYAAEEWAESWKKHFKPMDIGAKLRVCPPWLAGGSDRLELVINPGLSFGTGNHFTTRFCLEQLDRLVPQSGAKTMLDIGTGSGILAIAAVKLGAESALGVDFDELCVEQSVLNAAANGVAERTEFFRHDITDGWPPPAVPVFKEAGDPLLDGGSDGDGSGVSLSAAPQYDLVCANIYASLLIDNAATLLRVAKKYLLLTGIREVELDGVADTFVQLGGREIVRDCDREWSGLVMQIAD